MLTIDKGVGPTDDVINLQRQIKSNCIGTLQLSIWSCRRQ